MAEIHPPFSLPRTLFPTCTSALSPPSPSESGDGDADAFLCLPPPPRPASRDLPNSNGARLLLLLLNLAPTTPPPSRASGNDQRRPCQRIGTRSRRPSWRAPCTPTASSASIQPSSAPPLAPPLQPLPRRAAPLLPHILPPRPRAIRQSTHAGLRQGVADLRFRPVQGVPQDRTRDHQRA